MQSMFRKGRPGAISREVGVGMGEGHGPSNHKSGN